MSAGEAGSREDLDDALGRAARATVATVNEAVKHSRLASVWCLVGGRRGKGRSCCVGAAEETARFHDVVGALARVQERGARVGADEFGVLIYQACWCCFDGGADGREVLGADEQAIVD